MSEALVDVVVGVVAVDRLTPRNNKILLYSPKGDRPGLPTDYVADNETSLDTAARILRDVTGLQARIGQSGWVTIDQIGVMDQTGRRDDVSGKRHVSLIYLAAIPETVELQRGNYKWTDLQTAFNTPMYMDHSEISKVMMEKV